MQQIQTRFYKKTYRFISRNNYMKKKLSIMRQTFIEIIDCENFDFNPSLNSRKERD